MTSEEMWKMIWRKGVETIPCSKCPFSEECEATAEQDDECYVFLKKKYDKEIIGE